MKCPKCKGYRDHVVDTRPRGSDEIKRRRECYECGYRWNTIETYKEENKADGRVKN